MRSVSLTCHQTGRLGTGRTRRRRSPACTAREGRIPARIDGRLAGAFARALRRAGRAGAGTGSEAGCPHRTRTPGGRQRGSESTCRLKQSRDPPGRSNYMRRRHVRRGRGCTSDYLEREVPLPREQNCFRCREFFSRGHPFVIEAVRASRLQHQDRCSLSLSSARKTSQEGNFLMHSRPPGLQASLTCECSE